MPIYTRTGDKGETSLFGGKRVSKASLRVDAYGTVDELNSLLGVVIAQIPSTQKSLQKDVEAIQHDLFAIGSSLASPGMENQSTQVKYLAKRVDEFESLIDEMTEELPELRNFILPGGSTTGAFFHQARAVARRAERRLVELEKSEGIEDAILKYFNRLSDLFFTMARFANYQQKKKETLWIKHTG